MSLIQAPAKYAPYPGNADLVYDAICQTLASSVSLSERKDQVDWAAFSSDDWQMLVMMAKSEGVGPLLYWYLDGPGSEEQAPVTPTTGLRNVPDEVALALKTTYYQTAANNAVLFKELECILAAFSEAEIPVIVLKGAALAQTLYPDPGLRPMGDLDLFILSSISNDAIGILTSLGYQNIAVEIIPGLGQVNGYEIPLGISAKNGPIVELHWNASQDWLWEQTKTFDHGKSRFLHELNGAGNLIYLTWHITRHRNEQFRLLWYYDLHLLISKMGENFDYTYLADYADNLRLRRISLQTLSEVKSLFSTDILLPKDAYIIFSEEENNNRSSQVWDSFNLLTGAYRWRFLLAMIFPSPKFLRMRYKPKPSWLWPLLYFYRIIDILIELLRKLSEKLQ